MIYCSHEQLDIPWATAGHCGINKNRLSIIKLACFYSQLHVKMSRYSMIFNSSYQAYCNSVCQHLINTIKWFFLFLIAWCNNMRQWGEMPIWGVYTPYSMTHWHSWLQGSGSSGGMCMWFMTHLLKYQLSRLYLQFWPTSAFIREYERMLCCLLNVEIAVYIRTNSVYHLGRSCCVCHEWPLKWLCMDLCFIYLPS